MEQLLYSVPEYEEQQIYRTIDTIFQQLHILQELTPDSKVLLKPNLVMAKGPDAPVTTHPLIVSIVR